MVDDLACSDAGTAVAASLFVEPVEFAKGVSVKFPLAEDAGVRPLGLASLRVGPPD